MTKLGIISKEAPKALNQTYEKHSKDEGDYNRAQLPA